ncbi:MAG: thioredoxin family protein [Acidobacteria bacterium]|nr:thioredoxin family protein [Acidobacteriota bacterium]
MTFPEYIDLIDRLLAEGKTTGPIQTEANVEFTKLKRHRINRLENTIALGEGIKAAATGLTRKMTWLIIAEAWCGDSAPNVPVVEKNATESDNIEARYRLRDENLDLMDRWLTNGARSIPKLIAIDTSSGKVLGTWGSMPKAARVACEDVKANGIDKDTILEQLQRWCSADRSMSIQVEFERLRITGAKDGRLLPLDKY